MSELRALLRRHCHSAATTTPIPRLTLSRSDVKTSPTHAVYYPLLWVIAEGRKRVFLGNEEFHYDPMSYLVASLSLPVSGQVIEAPYRGLTLALDLPSLAALLLEIPPIAASRGPSKAMAVNKLDDELLDPILRLLRLLDRPRDIAVLAPLIEREILYRLLLGPRGEMLRQLALPASHISLISRAIDLIRRRYDQPLRVEDLARIAGMSAPSFHRHFRAVTAMSPLQFQKRIRLQEARRLLLSKNSDAASVGFDVGYESASQFSREYSRLFGSPPARDSARIRQALVPRNRTLSVVRSSRRLTSARA
jgi:AraC-like DNA-binding protein